jgi:trigger factor
MMTFTLAVDVDFTIEAINTTELAELNQELFDKLSEKEQ